eukprot:TRINITY_DN7887_c0_g1_i1.p1 TRINITY_DN7887_c0_g1~~TRINITY_DN7887_c0_g1_i1.p1  ORF type:complete len:374 (-),score=77.97 TRINITY_DN7887_c0_g1_i1:8-1099(-)
MFNEYCSFHTTSNGIVTVLNYLNDEYLLVGTSDSCLQIFDIDISRSVWEYQDKEYGAVVSFVNIKQYLICTFREGLTCIFSFPEDIENINAEDINENIRLIKSVEHNFIGFTSISYSIIDTELKILTLENPDTSCIITINIDDLNDCVFSCINLKSEKKSTNTNHDHNSSAIITQTVIYGEFAFVLYEDRILQAFDLLNGKFLEEICLLGTISSMSICMDIMKVNDSILFFVGMSDSHVNMIIFDGQRRFENAGSFQSGPKINLVNTSEHLLVGVNEVKIGNVSGIIVVALWDGSIRLFSLKTRKYLGKLDNLSQRFDINTDGYLLTDSRRKGGHLSISPSNKFLAVVPQSEFVVIYKRANRK